jgi:microcystin-dependent protein
MTSVLRVTSAMTAHEKPTVGDSKISFVSIDHLGWLRCDGRAVSADQYGLLYNVIGNTFGGSGKLFNLPNASGVVPGISSPSYPTGTLVGEYEHTLIIAEMPSHNHGVAPGGQIATNNLTSQDTHDHGGFTGLIGTGITINNNITGITINNNVTGISINNNSTGVTVKADEGNHSHTYIDAYFAENQGSGGGVRGTSAAIDTDNQFYYRTSTAPFWSATPEALTTGGTGTHNHTITDPQHNHTITDNGHIHNITDPQHNHAITDPTHQHTIASYQHTHTMNPAGGDQPHNNMQPTLFIGNLFIYSGDPPAGTWPYTIGPSGVATIY